MRTTSTSADAPSESNVASSSPPNPAPAMTTRMERLYAAASVLERERPLIVGVEPGEDARSVRRLDADGKVQREAAPVVRTEHRAEARSGRDCERRGRLAGVVG